MARFLPFVLRLLGCLIAGAAVLWMMGFFNYGAVEKAPVVVKSMVYNNPTYLFIAFGLIGLLIGFYTGFNDKPAWDNSLHYTITFITAIVVAGGASGFLLFKATSHQLQIVGGCLSMLAAFAIIGAIFGYVIRTQWPVSAVKKSLLDKENGKQIKLYDLQEEYLKRSEQSDTLDGEAKKSLEKTLKRMATILEQYGLITIKEHKEETGEGEAEAVESLTKKLHDENEEEDVRASAAMSLGNMGAPAIEHLISALGDESGFVRKSAADALGNIEYAVPMLSQKRQPVVEIKAVAPKPPVISTNVVLPSKKRPVTVRRIRKENVPLSNILSENEASIIDAQTKSITELLNQARKFNKHDGKTGS